jgi:hypothetical protein
MPISLRRDSDKETTVYIGSLTLYFSYETIVAYDDTTDGLTVSENIWSVTTGKHLNNINSNKSIRLNYAEFTTKLEECLKRHNL